MIRKKSAKDKNRKMTMQRSPLRMELRSRTAVMKKIIDLIVASPAPDDTTETIASTPFDAPVEIIASTSFDAPIDLSVHKRKTVNVDEKKNYVVLTETVSSGKDRITVKEDTPLEIEDLSAILDDFRNNPIETVSTTVTNALPQCLGAPLVHNANIPMQGTSRAILPYIVDGYQTMYDPIGLTNRCYYGGYEVNAASINAGYINTWANVPATYLTNSILPGNIMTPREYNVATLPQQPYLYGNYAVNGVIPMSHSSSGIVAPVCLNNDSTMQEIYKAGTPISVENVPSGSNANLNPPNLPMTTESFSVNHDFTDLLADVMSDIENDLQRYADFVNEK